MKKLLLASASPRRASLLKLLGVAFDIVPSGASEDLATPLPPNQHVVEIAQRKMQHVAKHHPNVLVLGADTVVALGNDILEKPKDHAHAKHMLAQLSGQTHQVYTGLSLIDTASGQMATEVAKTDVVMRTLTPTEIGAYVATGEPMDKAGAYAIQGRAAIFVESISGCFFNVVGLPLTSFWHLYQKVTGQLLPLSQSIPADLDLLSPET